MSYNQCRIGGTQRRPWYSDRIGTVHQGPPPREVIEQVLADPTLTLDHVCLRRLGLLPADQRTDDQRLADINAHLTAPAAPTDAGDDACERVLSVIVAIGAVGLALVWWLA